MFFQHVPKGGFIWEDKSKIEINCDINDNVANFRYMWTSRYCRKNYCYKIPCNTVVRTFDEKMLDYETELAESTSNGPAADNIRKNMNDLIKGFEENCEKNKLFFNAFD